MNKSKLLKTGILFLVLFLWSNQSFSQSIIGKWWSMLDLPQIKLRLVIVVDSTANGYQASLLSPDQGDFKIPATGFNFNYPDFELKQKNLNVTISGMVDANYKKINCVFEQGETSEKLLFTRDSIPPVESSIVAIKGKYNKKEVYITVRDGKKLFTSIYTPKDTSTKYPILFYRTPYNIEPGGKDQFNFFMSAYYRFVKENYIMVFQDVRGRFMSEGEFEDIRPFIPEKKTNTQIDEASDTYDAVDWLIRNISFTNGNIGVLGISYSGFYSTMAILASHPAIKAVSPQAPVTNWFIGDDFHHNGAMFLLDCFSFYSWFDEQRKEITRAGTTGFKWSVHDNYQYFLDEGSLSSIKKKFFGDTVKFWNDAFAHPNYDDFWKSRVPLQYLNDVKPAVMTVGGWFDAEDLYGTLHTYKAIEEQNPKTNPNFLVMGPWFHSQWAMGEANKLGNIHWGFDTNEKFHELEVKFFDYYLRGIGNGNFSEATIFITGQNKWNTFDTWPPKNATMKQLFFQPGGKISYSAPSNSESFDEYMSDPKKPVPYAEKVHQERTSEYMTDDQRFTSKRPDVMVYQGEVLTEDITLTGPITAELFVSTTGTDADYVVKLIDVFPEDTIAPEDQKLDMPLGGYQMLVRGEIFRGKYRDGFENPVPFKPKQITKVTFTLPDVAHTFKKGHRIMVQIQNSWFPLADSNPQKFTDIYKCTNADFQKAIHRIYFDKKNCSNIKVTVLNEDLN